MSFKERKAYGMERITFEVVANFITSRWNGNISTSTGRTSFDTLGQARKYRRLLRGKVRSIHIERLVKFKADDVQTKRVS